MAYMLKQLLLVICFYQYVFIKTGKHKRHNNMIILYKMGNNNTI